MAIFSFRPPPPGALRRRDGDVPADWAETMPSLFDDGDLAGRPVFVTDGPARPEPATTDLDPLPPLGLDLPVAPGPAGLPASPADRRPDPGFAKNLTARPQNDEGPGTGWYLSSWDLLQGCEVIEGTPIELLPPEWQRKRPRY